MKTRNLLAFDLGASNGRAMLARFDGERMTLTELHRFENPMIEQDGAHHWDAAFLLAQLKQGFRACKDATNGQIDCFGIDTWGVDFGLLDESGALIENPRCYRDATDEEMLAAWQIASKREIFERTGIAAMNFNTIYQLVRRVREADPALQKAKSLLLMPDLLGYLLTGEMKSEYTNVTTTNLYSAARQAWDVELIEKLDIPQEIFTPIDRAGTLRGRLTQKIADELGVSQIPFAAVGTHDTASAVAAIPGEGSFAFCSSGTWSLFGIETDEPLLGDAIYHANFSNEGTVQGGFRPLKNIMGQWIMQECRRDWVKSGSELSWQEIDELTTNAEPFAAIIDPDDAPFFSAGDMYGKIVRFCEKTGQTPPKTSGEVARCVYESLALKYRWALEWLEKMKGERIDTLNITGGGIGNKLLCQMTADALDRRVIAGPAEGSAMGNALLQAMALGEISDIAEARYVVRCSVEPCVYEPNHTKAWEDAYARLVRYMEK
ncbi:MAG TPA: rhamnulokinase family protein [Clostridia bacterium]|nr:rhamnulokinase family protein [Clostridia bacterium]